MKRKRLLARTQLFAEYKSGKAIRFIRSFKLRPGQLVYLICRVSNCQRRRNRDDQEANLHEAVEATGAIVVDLYRIVISGRNPYWLRQAAHEAREAGATVMLAETTDRFIRNRYFHSKKSFFTGFQA